MNSKGIISSFKSVCLVFCTTFIFAFISIDWFRMKLFITNLLNSKGALNVFLVVCASMGALIIMSKFSTTPSALHYTYLKYVAKYLRATRHWGIRYKRSKLRENLPPGKFDSIIPVPNAANDLPVFPVDINRFDAANTDDLRKCRSTTGFAFTFTYCGGAIVYRSKTQGVNALSSTEAAFIAAVTAAKTDCYLRFMLNNLHKAARCMKQWTWNVTGISKIKALLSFSVFEFTI